MKIIKSNKNRQNADLSLIILVTVLVVWGTVMVFSAGEAYAYARYDDRFYFIKKQII